MSQALAQAQRLTTLVEARNGASLQDLRRELFQLVDMVAVLPLQIDWPENVERPSYTEMMQLITSQWSELGFYNEVTGFPVSDAFSASDEIAGWAADDLADIVCELGHALQLSAVRQDYGLHWLRFSFEIHWGKDANDLLEYLSHLPN